MHVPAPEVVLRLGRIEVAMVLKLAEMPMNIPDGIEAIDGRKDVGGNSVGLCHRQYMGVVPIPDETCGDTYKLILMRCSSAKISARSEHSRYLGANCARVLNVFEYVIGNDEVDAVIRKGNTAVPDQEILVAGRVGQHNRIDVGAVQVFDPWFQILQRPSIFAFVLEVPCAAPGA